MFLLEYAILGYTGSSKKFEKFINIMFNYCLRECPQNNFTHVLRYFKIFPLIPFTYTSFILSLPQHPYNQG